VILRSSGEATRLSWSASVLITLRQARFRGLARLWGCQPTSDSYFRQGDSRIEAMAFLALGVSEESATVSAPHFRGRCSHGSTASLANAGTRIAAGTSFVSTLVLPEQRTQITVATFPVPMREVATVTGWAVVTAPTLVYWPVSVRAVCCTHSASQRAPRSRSQRSTRRSRASSGRSDDGEPEPDVARRPQRGEVAA
jgi:hypothetical protein